MLVLNAFLAISEGSQTTKAPFVFYFPLFALCFLVFALSQPIRFKKFVHVYY